MVSEERRALRAFMAIQALQGLSAIITMLAQYVAYIPSGLLIPFAVLSTLFLPGFALTWAIEGASIWKWERIRILVWSFLLSFGLNLLILLLLNTFIDISVWRALTIELVCALFFSAIGYKREKRALKTKGQIGRLICPNCGEAVRQTDIFCTNCGASLKREDF
ncbi:MAG: zinc ribbon domain-containing protein [Thermoproteota archaeon]